jgi:hypothetical protein
LRIRRLFHMDSGLQLPKLPHLPTLDQVHETLKGNYLCANANNDSDDNPPSRNCRHDNN